MKQLVYILTFCLCNTLLFAQSKKEHKGYLFNDQFRLDVTEIRNQERTGTCWSFSTTSFVESELMRIHGREMDISEMYFVRHSYEEKAKNYVLRQGKAQFGEGGLNHDVWHTFTHYGAVPQSAYVGKNYESDQHIHGEMEAVLGHMLDGVVKNRNGKLSNAWLPAYQGALDAYMGEVPESFTWEGKSYTPESFAASLELDPAAYVTFTSFTHHPFYQPFVLEVPDNWSNGSYWNVPLDELIQVLDEALKSGYTVAWDADVSEKTWSTKDGIAIIPETDYADMEKEDRERLFKEIVPEKEVTQAYRQAEFENYRTTDDHLMHIVGKAYDQNETEYYIVKNSWGTKRGIEGYMYISVPYMQTKTLGLMVHKDGVPKAIWNKLKRP